MPRRRARASAAAAAVLILGAGCADSQPLIDDATSGTAAPWPEGVRTFDEPSNLHVEGEVEYDLTPSPGGDHSATWLNCGIYDAPVADENAVHSLEHGAVWLSYRPDLPAEQVEVLEGLVGTSGYVVLSPHEQQDEPVVVTAWGVQLRVDAASDPRVERFLQEYVQGPHTPEPGAPCSGGVGTPVQDAAT